LLIHERFFNLPLELIGPLHRNLEEDLGWAQQLHDADNDSVSASEAEEFKTLQYVLLISTCTLQGQGQGHGQGNAKGGDAPEKRGKKRKADGASDSRSSSSSSESSSGTSSAGEGGGGEGSKTSDVGRVVDVTGSPSLLFDRFEDETYAQQALITVLCKAGAFAGGGGGGPLAISLIPTSSLRKCVQSLAALVPTNDATQAKKEQKKR